MIVLSLDLASHTGYAIRYDTGDVKVGNWNLTRGKVKGMTYKPMFRLWSRLESIEFNHDIGHVVYEHTFSRHGMTTHRLHSLMACCEIFCEQHNIPCSSVAPTVWKKEMLGKGNAAKTVYHQRAIEEWPELSFPTDDPAAARWILAYYEKMNGIDFPQSAIIE